MFDPVLRATLLNNPQRDVTLMFELYLTGSTKAIAHGFELYGPIQYKLTEFNPESLGDADSIIRIGTEEMTDLPQLNLLRGITCLHVSRDIPKQTLALFRVH